MRLSLPTIHSDSDNTFPSVKFIPTEIKLLDKTLHMFLLMGMNTHSRKTTLTKSFTFLLKMGLCTPRELILSVKSDPFPEGTYVPQCKQSSHKFASHLNNGVRGSLINLSSLKSTFLLEMAHDVGHRKSYQMAYDPLHPAYTLCPIWTYNTFRFFITLFTPITWTDRSHILG